MIALRLLALFALTTTAVAQIPAVPRAPWGGMIGEVESTQAIAWVRTDIASQVTLEITSDAAMRKIRRVGPASTVALGSAKFAPFA